jgi:hypothetical protein
MKFNLLLLTTLLAGHSIAQQKFIEVTVSDTVMAKANLFVYQIVITPEDDVSEFASARKTHISTEEITQQRMLKATQRLDSIKSVFISQGFLSYRTLGDSFTISRHDIPLFTARFITHTIDSLAIMYRQIKGLKNVMGILELAASTQDSTYQNRLFSKVLAKGRAKAEKIAAFSDQHIRGISSVTENKADETGPGGWTSYPPLSALSDYSTSVIPGWHTTIYPRDNIVADPASITSYPMTASFTIRFSVE